MVSQFDKIVMQHQIVVVMLAVVHIIQLHVVHVHVLLRLIVVAHVQFLQHAAYVRVRLQIVVRIHYTIYLNS